MVTEEIGKRVMCPIEEFRDRIDELLALVEAGETVAVTSGDRVLANLKSGAPASFYTRESWADVADFLEEAATWPPTGVTREELLAWRHEGHKR